MNYKLVEGPDGILWCSVQPLMQDIQQALKALESADTNEFTEQGKAINEFNITGMKAIYTFLGALLQEHKSNEYEKSKVTH